jgi:hypothetical protein
LNIPFSTYEQIIVGLILFILTAVLLLGWKRIQFYLIKRKIKPHLDEITESYRQEIGQYVETVPMLIVSDKKPKESCYGVIFVTPEEIDAVEQVFLINIPPACSLRKIRLLFDPNLKRALFDFFSWRLAIRRKREDIGSKILDNAIKNYAKDFKTIQKLHEEEKLSEIVLQEALRRLRKYKNLAKISPDDVNEYSKIVREWGERKFKLVLVGPGAVEDYTEKIASYLTIQGEVLALARGSYVKRLDKVCELCTKAIKPLYIKSEDDVWYYVEKDSTAPVRRIWFRRTPFKDVIHLKPSSNSLDA